MKTKLRGNLGVLFCITIPPCQSRTSSQVKRSPKKNFNATPTALTGTSPKYDKVKSECGFDLRQRRNDEVVKNLSTVMREIRELILR